MSVNTYAIQEGKASLGIELGSTRIKAVLVDERGSTLASGAFDWENKLENGIWTYSMADVIAGLQCCYSSLSGEVQKLYGMELTTLGSIGISAMMHGYLPFDKNGKQLAAFRTWRNTITGESASLLTKKFQFNIPQRWSVAHLYQAILNKESHVSKIASLTTLAGYVHFMLTGENVLGVGDASGMFPIDSALKTYSAGMLNAFDELTLEYNLGWKISEILPRVLLAGENAGVLTADGAKLLDASKKLRPGIPFCPPEGDAGTGMVATNSIKERTGNVSAGTSIFAMAVLEKQIKKLHEEIDMVTTPTGKPVAMVHCNNCTSDLDAWVRLFGEVSAVMGGDTDKTALYTALYAKALDAEDDCGGLLACNYLSGEHIANMEEGRPLFARLPDSRLTLANFMRAQLYSSIATLKLGMDILSGQENVRLDALLGHGGLFKVAGVAQRFLATALDVPVVVMTTAGEGGAWGIALLASYMQNRKVGETLEDYLQQKIFSEAKSVRVEPDKTAQGGFEAYMRRYNDGLKIERAAVEHLN